MRNPWAEVGYASSAKIYAMVTGLLILFLTARLLGPEGRGQVAVISTWVAMFGTAACLSLGQVALRRMTLHKDRLGLLLGSLVGMAIGLSLLGWLAVFGLFKAMPDLVFKGLPALALVIGFAALPLVIWEHYGSSLLIGLQRVDIYNRYQVIGRTVAVVGVLVLAGVLGLGIAGVLGASLLGEAVVALGGMGFLLASVKSAGQSSRADCGEIGELLKGGARLHLNTVGSLLITSVNVLVLNHYRGPEQAGYFQLAFQLVAVLLIVPQAASMVISGQVTALGPASAWPANRRMLVQITGTMLALGGVGALLAPWAIPWVAGEAFRPAVQPFQWLLLCLVGMSFSTLMTPQWIGRGYFVQAALLTVAAGVLGLGMNLWLIPTHGVDGAVWALLATYTFSVAANLVMAWHCNRDLAGAAA